MFSKTDGYRDVVMCSVAMSLSNGTVLSGIIQRPRAKKLGDYLNDGSLFIEIELYDGTVTQVSKHAIVHCELRDMPKADQLAQSIQRADVYHPIGTLGLESLKSKEAIQQAYRSRIALYHADRYASVELPREVAAYLKDMAIRVNAAYADAIAMLDNQKRESGAREKRPA